MDVTARLASNVRRQREALGLSQEQFADLVGMHRTYCSDIERGKRNPTIRIVEKIAAVLKVSPGSLLD